MEPSYNSGQMNPGTRPGMIVSGSNSQAPAPLPMSRASNKPRKGLIIGLILLVVVLIVTVVAVIVISNQGGGQASAENSDFYRYANYLINGNESLSTNIGEYDNQKSYAVVKAFEEKNTEYFDKLKSLWDKVYEPIMGDEELSEVSPLYATAETQNRVIEFLKKYIQIELGDGNDLLELYVNNGYEGAVAKVDEKYADLLNTDYYTGVIRVKEYMDYLKSILGIYAKHDETGCLSGGATESDCTNVLVNVMNDLKAVTFSGTIGDVSYLALNDLISACYEMNTLKGEK